MEMDEPIWDVTVFTKNRDRLLNQEIARGVCRRVVERAQDLMSDEHFTVDGTLIEAWASQKSLHRKDGGPDGDGRNVRGEKRKNDPMPRRRTRTRGCIDGRTTPSPGWPIWGIC